MKNIVKLFLILLFSANNIYGQFFIDWQECLGGTEDDIPASIIPFENGYFILGSTLSSDNDISLNHGGWDYWIAMIDSTGLLTWEKSFGGSLNEVLANGFYCSSNDYVYLVGQSNSIDGDISYDPFDGMLNLWVLKIDFEGNIVWDKKVGSEGGMIYNKYGIPTSDGGVILTAQIDRIGGDISNYYGGYDAWMVKLDANGDIEWDFTIGSSGFEFVNTIIQTNDGGYLIGAYGKPEGDGNIICQTAPGVDADVIVFKLDEFGNEIWQKCYGGSGSEIINSILELDDGFVFVAGGNSADGDLSNSEWHGDYDTWLIRTDEIGNIIWQKCYGGTYNDNAKNIIPTSENGFIIFGTTNSWDGDVSYNPSNEPQYNPSIWIFKIDNSGNLQWEKAIGSAGRDDLNYAAHQISDDNYLLAIEATSHKPSVDVLCDNIGEYSSSDFWIVEISDTLVGTHELPNSKSIFYPNPVSDYINIKLPSRFQNCTTEITISNIEGKILLSSQIDKQMRSINISHIASGFYILKAQNGSIQVTNKIIIQR